MQISFSRRALVRASITALGSSLVFGSPVLAQDAGAFIDGVARKVLDMLRQGVPDAQRESTLRTALRENFDLPAMGRAALGNHWSKLNAEQQKRYLTAVETAEVRAYSDRLKQYGGQTLKVVRQNPGPGGAQLVDSQILQPNGSQVVRLVWEVQNRGGKLQITDVAIEGVSMVLTRRSDFNAFISRNGGNVEPLIAELERRAK